MNGRLSTAHKFYLVFRKANSINFWFKTCGLAEGLLGGFISDLFYKWNRWTSCMLFIVLTPTMNICNANGCKLLAHHYSFIFCLNEAKIYNHHLSLH